MIITHYIQDWASSNSYLLQDTDIKMDQSKIL